MLKKIYKISKIWIFCDSKVLSKLRIETPMRTHHKNTGYRFWFWFAGISTLHLNAVYKIR
jgi:hypothetical protein